MSKLAFLLLLILQFSFCKAQRSNLSFSYWNINDGLSQSVANCAFQDSEGYLWIGTQNGLSRFDGYSFTTFVNIPGDTTTIVGNWIYDIVEDRTGRLWIGTKQGLSRYDKRTNTFRSFSYHSSNQSDNDQIIYGLALSNDGYILLNAPNHVALFNSHNNRFEYYPKKTPVDMSVNDQRIAIIQTTDGMVWAGAKYGLNIVDLTNGQVEEVRRPDGSNFGEIADIFQDSRSNVWIASSSGLCVYGSESDRMVDVSNFKLRFVRTVCEDASSNIFVGTEDGLCTGAIEDFCTETGSFIVRPVMNLEYRIVLDLLIDQSENLWVGTLQGLAKTDLKQKKFMLYRNSDDFDSFDLSYNVIASIFKQNDSILWVGTWGGGLNLLNRNTRESLVFAKNRSGRFHIPDDYVHVIFRDADNQLWLGTRDGLVVYDGNRFVRPSEKSGGYVPDLAGHRIYKIIQDKHKRFWIGTQQGLYLVQQQKPIVHFNSTLDGGYQISNNLIYDLLETTDGEIWVATSNGLNVVDSERLEVKSYHFDAHDAQSLNDNFVVALCEDHRGNVWIGTQSGLSVFDSRLQRFERYSEKLGVMNFLIYEIQSDVNKHLWLASQNGLSRLKPETGEIHHYTVRDGLQSQEFNLRACFSSDDGELFFGGMNGFNSFYPTELYVNEHKPNVIVSEVSKRDKEGVKTMLVGQDRLVKVEPTDFDITIYFSALDYTNSSQNQYLYRMEGVSDEWVSNQNRNYIVFSRLLPGKYTFYVKGSNNDGVWSDVSDGLVILVPRPWYQTFWAYFSYVLVLLFIIGIYIKSREARLVKERDFLARNEKLLIFAKEKAEESDRLKSAFLTNISHEIRTPLNGILGFSKMLLNPGLKQEKFAKYAAIIIDNGHQLLRIVNDILDISLVEAGQLKVSSNRVDLNVVFADLYKYFFPVFQEKSIELRLVVDSGQHELLVDKERLVQVMNNLIENALKFTDKGWVEFGFKPLQNGFRFFVRDTGIGIDEKFQEAVFEPFRQVEWEHSRKRGGNGLGLSISKRIVEAMGGSLLIDSKLGEGATFYFELIINADQNQELTE